LYQDKESDIDFGQAKEPTEESSAKQNEQKYLND